MRYFRDTTVNPYSGGDTVLQAILDLDHDLSGAYSALNGVLRGAAFRVSESERGASGGVCDLDALGQIPPERLPAIGEDQLPDGTVCPVGAIGLWPAESPPSGWVECDGAKFNPEKYPELYEILEYSYGGSESEGMFAVPDLRGVFVRGWDHGAGIDPDASSRTNRGDGTRGDKIGTKQADENLSHTHTVTATMASAGSGAAWFWPPLGSTPFDTVITSEGGAEGRPDNVTLMWIIKVTP